MPITDVDNASDHAINVPEIIHDQDATPENIDLFDSDSSASSSTSESDFELDANDNTNSDRNDEDHDVVRRYPVRNRQQRQFPGTIPWDSLSV